MKTSLPLNYHNLHGIIVKMKYTNLLAILLMCSSIVQICAEVTALCYMEPNRALSSTLTRVTGTVTLSQQSVTSPTKVTVSLRGSPRYTVHGFHVHKYGDVISKGCQSCGSHYSPFGSPHGGPRDKRRHVGDLGNVMSNADGRIETEFIDYFVSLHEPDSVIGRSLVLHAKIDDLGRGTGAARPESLKTGNAGARLACCAIVHAPPPASSS